MEPKLPPYSAGESGCSPQSESLIGNDSVRGESENASLSYSKPRARACSVAAPTSNQQQNDHRISLQDSIRKPISSASARCHGSVNH